MCLVYFIISITYDNILDVVNLTPEEMKIEALQSLSVPKNKKAAQSLLGFVSQLNCFFPDINKKVRRHRAMISLPDSQWKVTNELEPEFEELKTYLQSHIQLSPIRVGEPLNLYTDVRPSGAGISCIDMGIG